MAWNTIVLPVAVAETRNRSAIARPSAATSAWEGAAFTE